jgi:hypothetical protein
MAALCGAAIEGSMPSSPEGNEMAPEVCTRFFAAAFVRIIDSN